ncbi:DUF1801 domain-containing protein [Caulobacter sp. NIBR1757]|uniref:iron chaperone n=1 Tax=Caulobacter sp. NIBR1757 TaxID=3016000 RepID=UPI0022F01634|nr:DUF1801 domain-containing protein [Caulobacter sp. NIBR1757]WGM39059.1 hypothetical protein AMEJIAPC_01972 [Caulobacter sp. NIBR1757]
MVQSSAPTVDAYMLEVSRERLPYIQALREACLKALPGWEEKMSYGMPAYGPVGAPDVGVAFNSQKQHVAFYAGQAAIQKFAAELAVPGISCGKGCVRYMNPRKMDFAVIEAMLRDIHDRRQPAC